MPHPKSPSPPRLRSISSQPSNTGFPSESTSMRAPASFLSNASVRRISSSKRAYPAAASIADIFVRSLVLAGYCHEHAPQSRGLRTVSTRGLKGTTRAWGNRGTGRTHTHFPIRNPPNSRVGDLETHKSRTQRMYNSSVAQRLETFSGEDHRLEQTSPQGRVENTDFKYADCSGEDLRPSIRKRSGPDRLYGHVPHETRNGVRNHDEAHEEVDLKQACHWDVEKYPGAKSSESKLYEHTSEIYQAAFGKTLDWKKAVDAVAAFKPFPPQIDNTASAVDIHSVQTLLDAMLDKQKSNHAIFTLYRELPSPGIAHLSKRTRGALLRRFANPRDRRWVDARRYLALVDDMLTAGLHVSRSLWSSAIHLAGRATGKVTKDDLTRAIGVWNQMEHLGGLRSDGVTFTILFDIAIKAGQYTVADRLIEEMESRGLQFGRAGKVTQIYYYGLLRDTDAVRQAFDDFVESGEIVDTAVINCVLSSFLRAGETEMANRLYQQLLQAQSTFRQAPESDHFFTHINSPNLTSEIGLYRKRNKKIGRVLQLSASLKNSAPDHHRALQNAILVAPDTRTFHILLSHHAHKSGDLEAFKSVLDDMKEVFHVPPRGMIYLLLFDGFAHQGRHRRGWTTEKLWVVWKAYLRALYESKTRLHHRSYALPSSFIWENPLRTGSMPGPPTPLISTKSMLYTPLPSVSTSVQETSPEAQRHDDSQRKAVGDIIDSPDEDIIEFDGGIDISDILGQSQQIGEDDLNPLERRLENGVFLGRRMIIIILRAFGNCCGPEDIREVWFRMESIWQPEKRKGLDIFAVNQEVERQLERAEKRLRWRNE